METTKIALFQGKKVRKTVYKNEWWFVVVDVIEVLTDTPDPKDYLNKMRHRDEQLDKGYGQIVHPLFIETTGGRQQIGCSNTEGIFRIVQSIPSPKAEPFKRWLAKVGYERIQEIEDPELAIKRMRAIYKAKGYPDSWIGKRERGIAIREDLTDEWNKRGLQEQREYAILTAEISKATLGMTPSQYKKYKGLVKENLRDHMNDLELILTMLGEATTTTITKDRDSQGFPKLKKDSCDGGAIAGRTRKDIEKTTGKKVTSRENYLPINQRTKRIGQHFGK